MPAKKKGGKKKASKDDDGPKMTPKKYTTVLVCNAAWASMRFSLELTTDDQVSTVVKALQDRHAVGIKGLRLYMGPTVDEETMIDLESDPSLRDLGVTGGSRLFDSFTSVITYDYPPFRSALNLPVHTSLL